MTKCTARNAVGRSLYRSRTLREGRELRFGRMSRLRQDRGSCLSDCCT